MGQGGGNGGEIREWEGGQRRGEEDMQEGGKEETGDRGDRGGRGGRTKAGSRSGLGAHTPLGTQAAFRYRPFVCGPELACQPRCQRPNLFLLRGLKRPSITSGDTLLPILRPHGTQSPDSPR